MRFDGWLKLGLIVSILGGIGAGFLSLVGGVLGGDIGGIIVLLAFILVIPAGLAGLVAWVLGLAEVVTSKKSGLSKLLWVVAMFIFGLLTTLLYYFMGRNDLTA